jgi:anti-sigma B factor antagonist
MNTREFHAQVRIQDNKAVIDLHGEINGLVEADLNEAYTQAEALGRETIVLNFTGVEYINSTGIALIVGLLAQARKTRRQLIVFGLSDHYKEIFRITRLSDFMTIYPDEVSAISA